MAQAVNQNDLVSIIKSMTAEGNAILDMINNISSKVSKIQTFDKAQAQKAKESILDIGNYLNDIITIVSEKIAVPSIDSEKIVKNISIIPATINGISSVIKVSEELSNNGIKNIKRLERQIIDIENSYINIVYYLNNMFGDKKQTIISKTKLKHLEDINDIVSNICNIFEDLQKTVSEKIKNPKKIINILKQFIFQLYNNDSNIKNIGLIKYLEYLINESSLTDKSASNIKNVLQNTQEICASIAEIVDTMGILFKSLLKNIVAILAAKYVFDILLKVIVAIYEFNDKLSILISEKELDLKNMDDISTYFKKLSSLAESINESVKNIIIIGLLLPILAIAIPFAVSSLFAIGMFVKTANLVAKSSPDKKLNQNLTDLSKSVALIAGAIFIIGATIIFIAVAAPMINTNIQMVLKTLLIILGTIAVIAILTQLAKPLFNMSIGGTLQLMLTILVICGSILMVGATILITSLMAETVISNIPSFLKIFGVTLIILLAAVALALVATTIATPIFIGLAAIGLTILGLMVMTLLIAELAKPEYDVSQHKEAIIKNVGSIKEVLSEILNILLQDPLAENKNNKKGILGGILSMISPKLNSLFEIITTFAFLTVTVLSVGALVLIGHMLNKIPSIEKKSIKSKIGDIVESVNHLMSAVTAPYDTGEGNKNGLLTSLISWLSPEVANMIKAISTLSILVISLVSVGSLMFIGVLLSKIPSIDKKSVKIKVGDIVESIHYLLAAITAPYDLKEGKKGLLGSLINWIAPEIGHLIDAISSLAILGISFVCVGSLKKIAENLNYIAEIKFEKDKLIGKDGKSGAVYNILSTTDSVINAISGYEGETTVDYKAAKDKIEKVLDVVGYLGDINKIFNDIIKNDISADTTPGTILLLNSTDLNKVIEKIAENKHLTKDTVKKSKYYKSIIKNIYGKFNDFRLEDNTAKNSIDVTNKYIEFIDKIDKVNIEKLQTSVNLFEKMANFSKSINGNFEKLAESINEDLMPVLEELKETLNKIPEKIDTNAASVSQSISANAPISNQPSTQQSMTAQVRRENPNMSTEDVKKMVDNRLNEQARAQSQSLESKFDELIELLKSGLARVTLT